MARRDEGSILKAPGGGWYARLRYTDKHGVAREKKRTCKTHAIAKSTINVLRREVADEASDRKTYRELDQFFRDQYVHDAKFVGGKKISGFRQSTATVERYLDRALDFFGHRELDAITYADLRDYKLHIQNLKTERAAPRSVSDTNHHLKRVRRLFKIAIEQSWLTVDPFAKGSPLITDTFEVERTRVLTPAEEQKLLAAATGKRIDNIERTRHGNAEHFKQSINVDNPRLRAIIVLAIETAMRRGEIRTLRWSAVDLTGRVIRIEATNTKTLKPRLVPISARLRETLAQLRQNRLRPNSLVFGTADFRKSFNTAVRDAKIGDVHFHDLRHTAITRMLEKGISPPLVMKISGHTQQKTFMRYVNQTEQSVYEIALRLDSAA